MNEIEKKPLISIVVPVYNGEKYLYQALESVEKQSYKNFECLIANDGSCDRSAEIAQKFVQKDARFTMFSQANAGLAKARNLGLRHATGQYICYLDADDLLVPDALKKMLNIALNFEKPVIVCPNCAEYREAEDGTVQIKDRVLMKSGLISPVTAGAAFATCEVWGKLYPFYHLKNLLFSDRLTQKSQGEDLVYNLHAFSRVCGVFFDPDYTAYYYRVTPSSMSHGVSRLKRLLGLWDTAEVLWEEKDALKEQSYFREHMIRNILCFLKGIYSYSDAKEVVRRMNTGVGQNCWKFVQESDEKDGDSELRPPLSAQDRFLISLMAHKASPSILVITNWFWRIKNHFIHF